MSERNFVEPEELTPEEREVLSTNIITSEIILKGILEDVINHLRHTGGNCPRLCVGDAVEFIANRMNEEEAKTLLIMALRVLGEQQLQEQEQT